MIRILTIWMVLFSAWAAAGELESWIVVAHGQDAERIQQSRTRLEQILENETALKRGLEKSQAQVSLSQQEGFQVLQLGPFVPDERFAVLYLQLHDLFPEATVIERSKPLPEPLHKSATTTGFDADKAEKSRPQSSSSAYVPVSEKATDNDTIWTALFGLAIIGILYMFLSSDQLRRIKREHAQIEERQKSMEIRQHTVLAQMGENIHTLAQETASRTHTLAQRTQGALLHEDVQKVIEGENTLLGMTGDLIKFLQIKAHKVAIQAAPFDFNNVLHEVAGTLHQGCKESNKELIFNVARDVPKVMEADSLHMAQVLTNLIEYLMCHTPSREVRLQASVRERSDKTQLLEVEIRSDNGSIDEEMFFDAYYDEASGKYVGLGLFVAKELAQLMGGELTLVGGEDTHTRIMLTFSVGKRSKDQRQYRLPDRAIMDEKVLIIDSNPDVMHALKEFLNYFKMETTVMPPESLFNQKIDFSRFDIVAIDNRLFDASLVTLLKNVRKDGSLQVVSLENLYASHTVPDEGIADARMKKPLTQQHVFDILVQLRQQQEISPGQREVTQQQTGALEVFRGDFQDNRSIRLEDFSQFAGRRLMIVEDNLVNQKVLRGMLSKAGLILTIANNGQEALDRLEENGGEVDMILMDISMPIMDGFTATRRIHEDKRFQPIPIVTLTALVSEHEVDKMFEAGANGYLSKPLKIGRLYSAMERFLRSAESQEEAGQASPTPDRSNEQQGLDTRRAMGAMQNDTLLYREVLHEFKEIYGNSDAVFEKLIRDTRYEQLRALCVDLRGLAGSIGAQGLFEVVTEVQTLLVYKKYELLERQIEPYREELTRLNDAIERYLR